MHATVRRYEGVDEKGKTDLRQKVNESLIPKLSKLPGFGGYLVIDSGNGVLTSISLFANAAASNESNAVTANWVRDEKLEPTLPNPPMVTGGEVFAYKTNGGMIQA